MFKGWGRELVKAVRLRVALLRWSVKGRTQAPEYPPAVRPLAKQVDRVVLIPSWRGEELLRDDGMACRSLYKERNGETAEITLIVNFFS